MLMEPLVSRFTLWELGCLSLYGINSETVHSNWNTTNVLALYKPFNWCVFFHNLISQKKIFLQQLFILTQQLSKTCWVNIFRKNQYTNPRNLANKPALGIKTDCRWCCLSTCTYFLKIVLTFCWYIYLNGKCLWIKWLEFCLNAKNDDIINGTLKF